MAAPPTSTKTSLQQRLSARARERWPQLAGLDVRFRGAFAYVTANMPDGDSIPLMRLRYGGSAARWGFAVYLASKDGYEDSVLPTGDLAGAPEDALDTACGLYLGDPTAWACPPTNLRARPLSLDPRMNRVGVGVDVKKVPFELG
jgi:hypothetical protein